MHSQQPFDMCLCVGVVECFFVVLFISLCVLCALFCDAVLFVVCCLLNVLSFSFSLLFEVLLLWCCCCRVRVCLFWLCCLLFWFCLRFILFCGCFCGICMLDMIVWCVVPHQH